MCKTVNIALNQHFNQVFKIRNAASVTHASRRNLCQWAGVFFQVFLFHPWSYMQLKKKKKSETDFCDARLPTTSLSLRVRTTASLQGRALHPHVVRVTQLTSPGPGTGPRFPASRGERDPSGRQTSSRVR